MAATFFLRPKFRVGLLAALVTVGATTMAATSSRHLLEKDLSELSVEEIVEWAQDLQSNWQTSGEFTVGLGWDSNLLLSSLAREESAFVRAGVEGLVWRPDFDAKRVEWIGYVSAAHRRMFNPHHLPDDTEAFLHGEARWKANNSLRLSAVVQAYYMDTVIDLSTESERLALPLTARGLVGGGVVRWESSGGLWFEANGAANRSGYRLVPEDYREDRLAARLGWHSRDGSLRLGVGVRGRYRRYDERNFTAIGGRPIPGTRLPYRLPEGDLSAVKTFKWHGDWEVSSGIMQARNRDNGAGFFDYRLDKWKMGAAWTGDPWRAEVEWSESRYRWDIQVAGIGINPPLRRRVDREVAIRAERRLGPSRFAFAEARRECVASNDPSASYNVTVVSWGLGWNI